MRSQRGGGGTPTNETFTEFSSPVIMNVNELSY